MKKICHKGLAELVGKYGSIPMEVWALEVLIKASIEPDEINKQKIAEDIINSLIIPIEWLVNHTIKAKSIAIRCIWEAYNAKSRNDTSWLRYLGWATHFIADWGTPPHSPTSRSNPVPALVGAGAIIGGVIGGIEKSGSDLGEILIGIAKGALIGAGISGVAGLIGLAIEHSDFEIKCDKHWESIAHLIKDNFIRKKGRKYPPEQLEQALEKFELMMDNLRQKSDNLPSEFKDNIELAEYMADIAVVMDFAFQIIAR